MSSPEPPFPLPANEAHLWYVEPQGGSSSRAARYHGLLSPTERERHGRFVISRPADEFLLGRALLRATLGRYLGINPREVDLQLGPHGKPELGAGSPRFSFNLAHSPGIVACLIARDCDVGFDVEDTENQLVEALELAERFFDEAEFMDLSRLEARALQYRFFQYWTLKEACLKALGTGLAESLTRFCFSFRSEGTPVMERGQGGEAWQVGQLELTKRHVAALAIKGCAPLLERRVVVRRCIPLHEDWADGAPDAGVTF